MVLASLFLLACKCSIDSAAARLLDWRGGITGKFDASMIRLWRPRIVVSVSGLILDETCTQFDIRINFILQP